MVLTNAQKIQTVQECARAELVAREANRRPPTRQQLKRLTENRADRGRLSLAMKAVEQLHCLQTGQEQARRLSYDEAKGIIKDLHPERTEDAESLPCGDMGHGQPSPRPRVNSRERGELTSALLLGASLGGPMVL